MVVLACIEEDTGAGQKDEGGSAKVGDPAGEEDSGRGAAGRNAGKDTYVIDGHQHHDRAADEVDGCDAGFRGGLSGEGSGNDGSAHDSAPGAEYRSTGTRSFQLIDDRPDRKSVV